MAQVTIEVTKEHFDALKCAYEDAVKNNKDQFEMPGYPGQMVLTTYAKYMIEYLEPKFKRM
jgi:hypothetical protein